MKQLSGLDASFLHLETPEMPMHVGGLNVFELPKDYRGDFHEDVKAHIVSRMHLASIFTKKLALMPFDMANPVWVDDDAVDIDYHIRKITLPKPGTMAQLETYVGRLHSSLLDRSRPLWEFYVFDGMKPGQAAFYSKIHHAALDGKGGEALAQAMLDITPVPRTVKKAEPRHGAVYQPSVNDLVGAAFRNNLAQYWKLIKLLPAAARAIGDLALPAKGEDGKRPAGMLKNFKLGPKTPLNVAITNQRAFSTVKISLAEAREIGKAFDGSLNDAVMAICSGALRRYLASRDALPDKTLVAAVPVSLREEGNTELNNQVSMMLLNLATDIADPRKRTREIVKASKAMKQTLKSVKSVMPTDFPSLGAPWLMSGLVSLYGRSRLADKMAPIANVAISNVPGANVPLYLAGARMTTYFPVSIVVHGVALNITVQSYDGNLDFGLIACRRAVPDIRDLARMMTESHEELLDAARRVAVPVEVKTSVAIKAKAPAPEKSTALKASKTAASRKTGTARAKPASTSATAPSRAKAPASKKAKATAIGKPSPATRSAKAKSMSTTRTKRAQVPRQ
jgi:WS/DGAT/MGAT family acyltransferase